MSLAFTVYERECRAVSAQPYITIYYITFIGIEGRSSPLACNINIGVKCSTCFRLKVYKKFTERRNTKYDVTKNITGSNLRGIFQMDAKLGTTVRENSILWNNALCTQVSVYTHPTLSGGLWSVWFLTLVVYIWNWFSVVEIMICTQINVNQIFWSILWLQI